jgi:nicotinamide riboside kinase
MPSVQRIAVIGAECTGKTSLCEALAGRHGGLWVPEALREFVDHAGRAPHVDEQAPVMWEQMEREAAAVQRARAGAHKLVAFDSAPLATALYSRLYFADDSLLAPALEHHRGHYDTTLVTDIDLPWEPDGLQRDGPDMRQRFHALLIDCLARHAIGHTPVQGMGATRLLNATRAVDLT